MIKKLIKILSAIIIIVILAILYLSFIGIKTEKFNKKIKSSIFEINKKISLDLEEVKFLLDLSNFTVNITTKSPTVLINKKILKLEYLSTNILLKSLIFEQFSIDDLQISTKQIKLNDAVLLARSFKNSTPLFLLDKIIEDGFLVANIKIKFDEKGRVKDDYQINGLIKEGKLNFLNKLKVSNLDFKFDIKKNTYFLKEIKTKLNNIKLSSPLVKIDKKNDVFFVKGKILNNEVDLNTKQLKILLGSFSKNFNVEKINFNSINNFSFEINKKLKLKNLKIKSKINIGQMILDNNLINLRSYLPDLKKKIDFENHKIIINYSKERLEVNGKGQIAIDNKFDSINYNIIKNNDQIAFDTKVNLKKNRLSLDFLDYKKKENLEILILVKGIFKKNKSIKFDLISLVEKNNKILFKNLNFDNNFKVMDIGSLKFDYLNTNKIKNQLILIKKNSNYIIKGRSFDASNIINDIMDSEEESSSLFSNINSKITLNIDKTYIDVVNFTNDLSGEITFKNNKINYLNLNSTFSDNKKMNFSIEINNQQEKITKLFTDYPKPLVKRYAFINGFEEGYLNFHSIKKDGMSNSLLIIDNFKVQEVPIFAKILSLASLQGVADLLTGEGIRFSDFEMKFSSKKGLTTIDEMYAIGPAVSILMDGYIQSEKLISLRGTLVPATTINRSIASIPLLGKILIGEKTGEGVFGVSFKIKGDSKNLKTTVNPIKTLTPRFITRTLEKIKKN